MDIIMVGIFTAWVVLVIAWIAYMTTTNKVIKQQEREIHTLKTDKMDLLHNMDKAYSRGYTDGMTDALHGLEVKK